jgi:hypothetical protein
MGNKTRSFRTTITVPQDLKARMDAVREQVNWSALACRAFEEKLAEIASKKEKLTVDDVIQRLKLSREQMESAEYKDGEAVGRDWASRRAEAAELTKLESFLAELDGEPSLSRGRFFSDYGSSAFSTADHLYFALHPEEQTRDASRDFWETVLGDKELYKRDSDDFLRGFAEGAEAVWDEVKHQL